MVKINWKAIGHWQLAAGFLRHIWDIQLSIDKSPRIQESRQFGIANPIPLTICQKPTASRFQNLNINSVPSPKVDFTEILPSCTLIICRERLSPMPEPVFLVEKKGMNIFSSASGSMPGPLSRMLMMGLPFSLV